jgi:4-hydroxythreonine-4-phosphate dehydrogenase
MTLPLAITLGDPAGIGPEVTFKSIPSHCPILLIGSKQLLNIPSLQHHIAVNRIHFLDSEAELPTSSKAGDILWFDPTPNILIQPFNSSSETNAHVALQSVISATTLATQGRVRGIVTAPISKRAFQLSGAPAWDHTRLLGHLTNTNCTMGFYSDVMKVVLTTVHIPLAEVSNHITETTLSTAIRRANTWLISLGIPNPKIAVAGLNPHAGEDGLIGTEELTVITPTITQLRSEIPHLSGPYPADTLFWKAHQFDCIIAQYHDQGLGPLKMVAFETAVNTTLGLPFIRTSPDHGTAYDIAYHDCANPSSMTAAITLALRMSHGN